MGGLIDPLVRLTNVSVDIPIFGATARNAKGTALQLLRTRRRPSDTEWVHALRHVDFEVSRGDRVALIGANGAGKTTLLRVLAGILQPSEGVRTGGGRVSAMFDMGLGMDFDATGRENVYLRGLLLGESRDSMARRLESILDFADLGNRIDHPVRTYSSGMVARLSFAIATSLRPELLLIDEGIGVADARFAAKAEARMVDLVNRAGAVVLASHAEPMLRRLCDRGVVLDRGRCVFGGDLEEALSVYTSMTTPVVSPRKVQGAVPAVVAVSTPTPAALPGDARPEGGAGTGSSVVRGIESGDRLVTGNSTEKSMPPPPGPLGVHPANPDSWPDEGQVSPDGVAISGRRRVLFLFGGSNSEYDQYRRPSASRWGIDWANLVAARHARAVEAKLPYTSLFVPNKATSLASHFPLYRPGTSSYPWQSLRDALRGDPGAMFLDDLVPDELKAEGWAEGWGLVDSHWSAFGSAATAQRVLRHFALPELTLSVVEEEVQAFGDLSSRWGPVALAERWDRWIRCESPPPVLIRDNGQGSPGGGVVGRVVHWECPSAPAALHLVVVGNSFAGPGNRPEELVYWLSRAVTQCTFVHSSEVPVDLVEALRPTAVLFQGLERFLPIVPRDQRSLVEVSRDYEAHGAGQQDA